MSQKNLVSAVSVVQSETTTSAFHVSRGNGFTVHVGSIAVANSFHLVSAPFDTSSFYPVTITPPGAVGFDVGSGNLAINFPAQYSTLGYVKIVFATPLTHVATLNIIGGL